MTRWISTTDDPAWSELFTRYERSAFRLEGQQMYSSPAEDDALARFLAGEEQEFDLSRRNPPRAGRTKTTVRIVVEPPTAYTRLELLVYPHLVAAGEEVRIIAVSQGQRPWELPPYDFWLFDDRDVWKMHYFENFRFAGAELLDDRDTVSRHRGWRDLALERSVSLQDHLAVVDGERSSA